jgi:hypothetical protein
MGIGVVGLFEAHRALRAISIAAAGISACGRIVFGGISRAPIGSVIGSSTVKSAASIRVSGTAAVGIVARIIADIVWADRCHSEDHSGAVHESAGGGSVCSVIPGGVADDDRSGCDAIDLNIGAVVGGASGGNCVDDAGHLCAYDPRSSRCRGDKPYALVTTVILPVHADNLVCRVDSISHQGAFDGHELRVAIINDSDLGVVNVDAGFVRNGREDNAVGVLTLARTRARGFRLGLRCSSSGS